MPKDLVQAMRIRGILSHDGVKIIIKPYHGRLASVCPDMSFISSSDTINPTLSYSLEEFVLFISSQPPRWSNGSGLWYLDSSPFSYAVIGLCCSEPIPKKSDEKIFLSRQIQNTVGVSSRLDENARDSVTMKVRNRVECPSRNAEGTYKSFFNGRQLNVK